MSHIINSIGVEVFGVISICLFIVVFSATMIGSLSLKNAFLQHMGRLPLNEEESRNNESTVPPL